MPTAIIDRREISSEGILPTCEFTLIYVYEIPGLSTHTGLLKVGETTLKAEFDAEASDFAPNCGALNKAADRRIQQDLGASGIKYNLLHTELAIDIEGRSFSDKNVHRVLKSSGFSPANLNFKGKKAREWFKTDLRTARLAIASVKNKMPTISYELPLVETSPTKTTDRPVFNLNETPPFKKVPPEQFEFRDEQERAIKKTVRYFEKKLEDAEPSRTGKRDREFLWNAKMRFGKTLCALEVVKRLKFRRTLIVTHRPVVRDGWGKDFKKIFRQGDLKEQYEFSFNRDESFSNYKNTKNPLIYFASLQYLRRLDETLSGIQEKKEILGTDWDLVIVDEAHEGTQTELGAFVLENLKKNRTCLLHLSGTPFNMAKDFDESNSFTWDYLMEQRAKLSWPENHPGEHNPYDDLPNMNILVYSLGDLEKTYMDVADKCFSFTEFFSIGDDGKTFAHEQDVKKFLDLLAGKSSKTKTYPFSTDEYREFFRHTFWVVPGVKQGAALEKLLNEHEDFGKSKKGKFKIVNVCGNGSDDENAHADALKAVQNAIAENERTITLSCGKLTLGVSVPEWTAVFYLAGSYHTRVATYMQTIFRAQTPGCINGKAKKECYVFDFAPDRTLTILDEVAQHAAKANNISLGRVVGKLLNNFNVISVDGSQTRRINENSFFSIVNKACVTEIVRNGFESIKLFDDDLLKNLSAEDMKIFDGLKEIIGSRRLKDPITEVPVNEEGLTGEEHEIIEDNPDPKKKKPPKTKEQREAERRRKVAIATLLNATVRIPLLVFGAGAGKTGDKPKREFTIENFTENFDPESWKEFMGDLSMEAFNEKVVKWLRRDRFTASCQRIRERVEDADSLPPKERMEKIVEIHSEFKNPNKETVLTPWRVVNMHLGDTLGGYSFYDEIYEKTIWEQAEEKDRVVNPRLVPNEAAKKTLENPDAKILEINSKTGLYPLYVAYSLMRAKLVKDDSSSRKGGDGMDAAEKRLWKEVIEKNLFIICRTKMAAAITRRTLLGFDADAKANIRVKEDFVETAAELVSEKNDKNFFDRKEDAAGLRARRREERLKALEKFLKEIKTWEDEEMEFNAIVGNPPYQKMDEGNSGGSSASPLYHHVFKLAKKLNPEFISLIIPSRWFTAGKGLDDFREEMLNDKHIKILHDFTLSQDVFHNVAIKGGICYSLWDREHNGECSYTLHDFSGKPMTAVRFLKTKGIDVFIRYPVCAEILEKVRALGEKSFFEIVSERRPFKLGTNFFDETEEKLKKEASDRFPIVIHGLEDKKRVERYVRADFFHHKDRNREMVIDETIEKRLKGYKIFVPKARGAGGEAIGEASSTYVLGTPVLGTPNSACTETYILVGPFKKKAEAENALSYLKTKTFRLLASLRKNTQDAPRDIYSFVPMQDFSEPWTDERLFKKYKFTEEERDFIKKMIAPMK